MTPVRISIPSAAKGRLGVLDELKGVAIILVVAYHASGVLSLRDILHPEVGVDMFVILSGIGLGFSGREEPAGRFLLRRFMRIYPTYWVVLAALLLADGRLRGMHYAPADILLHATGLHAWFGDAYAMSISDAFWFITLIVSLYVAYVPLRRLWRRPDLLLLAGSVLSVVPILVYFHWSQPAVFGHMAVRIPGFFAGLVVGRLLRQGNLDIPVSAGLGAAFFLLFYVTYAFGIVVASFVVGLAIMGAYAFLLRPVVPGFARSGLAWLGIRSLAIYLVHQPLVREFNVYVLQRYFPEAGITPLSLSLGIIAGLCATLAVSAVLYRTLGRICLSGPGTPSPMPGAQA
ncbi:MAG TPA: acyltransferase [Opitutaceae bacterium]|jgi:peptidoglycan/LPS O-acetylase OafA/YrhL